MSIDKQKLQKLLWSEVASWKADCAEWKQNTEALGEFLGEKTVEEVALELLAENEALRSDIQSWRLSIEAEREVHKLSLKGVQDELDRLKGPAFTEELTSLRKNAERYRFLRDDNSKGKADFCIVLKHWGASELNCILELEEADDQIDAAMGKGEQS